MSAADKLTKMLFDAVRRFVNLPNALITRKLPKIVTIIKMTYMETKRTFRPGDKASSIGSSKAPVGFMLERGVFLVSWPNRVTSNLKYGDLLSLVLASEIATMS